MLTEELGERFEIARTSIKKWCVATPAQAPLDALDTILKAEHLTADAIASVTATLGASGARVVNGDMPNVNAAHLLALLAIDGELTFHSSHDAGRMRDPLVLAMRERVRLIPSEAIGLDRDAVVEVSTRDGRMFMHHARHVRGTPENAMDANEVTEKAADLLTPVLGKRTPQLIAALLRINTIADVRELRELLRA